MKSERTKDHIFRTALRLFSEQGYASTTIRKIANEADLSLGLLYRYFPSKEALGKEALQYCLKLILDDLSEVQPNQSFRSMYERAKTTVDSDHDLWSTWNNLRREPTLSELTKSTVNEALSQLIGAGHEDRSIDLLIKVALIEGLQSQEQLIDNLPLHKMIDRIDQLFRNETES